MIQLSREIRFALTSTENQTSGNQKNTWAAYPATHRIVPHLVLAAVVQGEPDPLTGYLCNVTLIDQALRKFVFENLIPNLENLPLNQLPSAESITRQAFAAMNDSLPDGPRLVRVSLHLSPYLGYAAESEYPSMIELTQQFEFSAAHRLHCDSLTDEENIATFGKCNNPSGHGHNYVVEVTVAREVTTDDATVIEIDRLAEIVNTNVIDPLDHKNLNTDIAHFANTNPSVENIACAVFDWLSPDITKAGCVLKKVKVHETPKTWATYTGV